MHTDAFKSLLRAVGGGCDEEGEGDAAKWSRIDLSGAEGPSGSGCPRADEERQQTEVGIAAPPPADRSSAFHERAQ